MKVMIPGSGERERQENTAGRCYAVSETVRGRV